MPPQGSNTIKNLNILLYFFIIPTFKDHLADLNACKAEHRNAAAKAHISLKKILNLS